MRCEAVSERMHRRMRCNACLLHRLPYSALDSLVADMMASDLAASRV
jgi:hypothetical protein